MWKTMLGTLLAFAVESVSATIPSSGTYYGCYLKSVGSLRVIDFPAQRCLPRLEVQLTWPDPSVVAALVGRIEALEAQVAALQDQIGNESALAPFVHVEQGEVAGVRGPNIILRGANVWVQSGSGATDDDGTLTGLGNLIVGYDGSSWAGNGNRSGSHNLVVGDGNSFSAYGGVVFGAGNTSSAQYSAVTGGGGNTASGIGASVCGGYSNTASGQNASVTGGQHNIASGGVSSVTGGDHNKASGSPSSVAGGWGNTASGESASVCGGGLNLASQVHAVVSGGSNNTASAPRASVAGGRNNVAEGDGATVSGGLGVTQGFPEGWSAGSEGTPSTGSFRSP